MWLLFTSLLPAFFQVHWLQMSPFTDIRISKPGCICKRFSAMNFTCILLNCIFCTGKSLSEALIFTSTNPQYDDRLFIELQVQYMKIPSSEHGENMLCTEIVFDIQNNLCTQHVLPMFCKNKSFWQRFTCTDQAPSSTLKPEAQVPKAASANPAESASTADNETPSFPSQILEWIRSVVREFFRRLFHGTPYQLA